MTWVDPARLPGRPRVVLPFLHPRETPETEAAWLQERARGLGGSEIAAALGVDDYQTPLGLYLRKTGQLPGPEPNEHMAWGRRLEPIIAEWAAEETGATWAPGGGLLAGAERDWMRCTLDGFLGRDGGLPNVLEVKNSGRADAWADDGIPPAAEAQARWYLAVTGLEAAIVAALLHGTVGVLRFVRRDERVEDALIRGGEAFWARVLEGRPPAAGSSAREARELGRIPLDPGLVVDLDETWRARLEERRRLRQQRAEAEAALRAIDNQLKADMSGAAVAYLDGERAAWWRSEQRGRVSTTDVLAAHPELGELFDRYRGDPPRRLEVP